MSQTVGIGVLVEDTGESARTLQHWCDLGILKPLPGTHKQGRGVAREFSADFPLYGERALALIASRLNRLRIPLAVIGAIVSAFRDVSVVESQPDPSDQSKMSGAIYRALNRSLEVVYIALRPDAAVHVSSVLSTHYKNPDAAAEAYVRPAVPLSIVEPGLFIQNEVGYFLNLTRTLKPLRSRK